MAKLLLNCGNGQAQEFFLPSGSSRMGRDNANEIQIEHPSVSSFHCEITSASDSVTIKDLGSTNGTFIEGRPVQEAALAHGQRLQLGSVEMILDLQVAARPAVPAASLPAAASVGAGSGKPRLSVRLEHSAAPAATPAHIPAVALAAAGPVHPTQPKNPLQIDRAQAEQQARSKMFWGDPIEDVIKYLRMQGLSIEEASSVANALLMERVATIRGIGIRKIVIGILLMCVPVVCFVIFSHMILFPLKLFGMSCAVGLYGGYLFLKGSFMLLAPKSEPGDVADK